MELDSIRKLHRSMLQQGVDMQQFQIRTGAMSFDCLFSTREAPFVLSLTSRDNNPKFFKFEVKSGYRIAEYFDYETYANLLSVLRVDGKSREKLIPKHFLAQINQLVPTIAKRKDVPSIESIIRIRHDLEERDKPYFDTWIYWRKDGVKAPSEKNLTKTLLILGVEAYRYSRSLKASSRWSRKPTGNLWTTD